MAISRARVLVLVGALSALGLACADDSTAPVERPADQLNIVRLSSETQVPEELVLSFWAKRGEDREGRLYLPDGSGGQGTEFARVRVNATSLRTRPDGTPFQAGDSVLITLRVADPSRILFELEPSGLEFDREEPAELRIRYDHADDDFNGDGKVDDSDARIEGDLAIWRQESPDAPFERLNSVQIRDDRELRAELRGFSRYAVAY